MANSVDLIIRNARLIDGTGAPSAHGDIAINDDRIAELGDLRETTGATEIDAGGKAVAPGFIDVHTHDDRALLVDPLMAPKVSQGVTTVVTGNCGVSLAPLRTCPTPARAARSRVPRRRGLLRRLRRLPRCARRRAGGGQRALPGRPRFTPGGSHGHAGSSCHARARSRPCDGRLEQALEDGAIGLSTGLFYAPANAAPTDEIIELARAVRAAGGIHTTHMRDEGDGVSESLEETFTIGRSADVPVVVSHHKCAQVRPTSAARQRHWR